LNCNYLFTKIVKFKKQFIKEHTQLFNIYLLLFALVPPGTPHLPIMVMASPFTIVPSVRVTFHMSHRERENYILLPLFNYNYGTFFTDPFNG